MDDAIELSSYLPLSFKSPAEQEYIAFLWDAFETNYTHGRYQFAFLAYHMLTMSFVYFEVWQIRQNRRSDFEKALVGFRKDDEKKLLDATSPFALSLVNESTVLRFLKLIGCDNVKVGNYAKLVQARNDAAHSNGNIFFSTQEALDVKILEILRIVDEIQRHSGDVIIACYREFLNQHSDSEEWQFSEPADQVREVLIQGNYLSERDLKACLALEIASMESIVINPQALELHSALQTIVE